MPMPSGTAGLTGADEEGTHRALGIHLDTFTSAIEECGGRVVHFAGDAVLAEFASVFVALECAVTVQRRLAESNREVAEERRLEFRVGINLGDVIVDRDDLYGDGVNIAARLESLAEPGGICISEKVYAEVRNKLELGFDDRGEQRVKNISEPVRAYRVRFLPGDSGAAAEGWKPTAGRPRWVALAVVLVVIAGALATVAWWRPWAPRVEFASVENMAFPLPEKPSIAVLPFDNLSSDPEQGYFADGFTENIITTLSQIHSLFVIARNSTFVYKGKPVKVQQVAEELGVRYVLEGSVQKAGVKVRITAQLIDALTGNHMWAQSYDRELGDLFAVQDEITHEIVFALQVELTEGEQLRVWRRQVGSIEAWNLLARGMEHMYRFVKVDNALARELFEEAMEMDPLYAMAYALAAWTHWMDAQMGYSENPSRSVQQAMQLAQKAMALDSSAPDVHALFGALSLLNGDYQSAVASAEKAVALNPNHATNMAILGMILRSSGKPEEAIPNFLAAMRLSPYYPDWFISELGWTYIDANQHQLAISAFREYHQRRPEAINLARTHIGIAFALSDLGREDEARAEVAKALAAYPKFTVSLFSGTSLNADETEINSEVAILRRLGVPD